MYPIFESLVASDLNTPGTEQCPLTKGESQAVSKPEFGKLHEVEGLVWIFTTQSSALLLEPRIFALWSPWL